MKAELKYFIMISPVLLGKLKRQGPSGLSGVELNCMHWQDQARLHVVLFCLFWLKVLSSISFVNVPGIPAFWTDVFIWWLLIRKFVIRQARTLKNIFPSTFRRDIGQKFVISFDCISFGIQISSARHNSCGTIPFFQTCWRRTVCFLRTHG